MSHALPQPYAAELAVSSRSRWRDPVWHLDGVRPGTAPGEFSLNWAFKIGDGRFTDPKWRAWCEATKTFLWSLKADPPPGRRPVHESTLVSTFKLLRLLIRWMASEGYRSFAELNREASERFMAALARRPGTRSPSLTCATQHQYRNLLVSLYLQGARYPEVRIEDPFPGRDRGWLKKHAGRLPYTPDPIAVALVSAALRLIGTPAEEILALRDLAQSAYDEALRGKLTPTKASFAVVDAISAWHFSTLPGEAAPWNPAPIKSTKTVRQLIDRLYEACFVVVAYLIGARVSEIVGLKVGCIEHRRSAADGESFAYLVGSIYKTAPQAQGKVHRWVAPPAVERAISVMERLSRPLRERAGREELWLISSSTGLLGPEARIALPSSGGIATRLNRSFAPYIDLPLHQGKRWRLNTHQGRKTFARFVGKRDRTGLHALQVHFGHVSRVMTDQGYVGTDFALDELIDRQAQEETRAALEELLTATSLAGKSGRLIASRSQFRGRTHSGELKAYVEFLMSETDLRLGACDWGYCVYRMEASACAGNEKGPNPVLRTESVCVSCANFAVTSKHRPVWEARRARHVELLKQPKLDPQSRAVTEARIAECDRLLAQLDAGAAA